MTGVRINWGNEDEMGRVISYDLRPGATAADLNNLIAQRSYEGSPPILLGPGIFTFASRIVLRPYVRIQGAGRNRTRLRAGFSPSTSLADDPTNSFISLAAEVVSAFTPTTLSARAFRNAYKINLTSLVGVAAGKWLRVKGVNTLNDEYLTSAGPNNVSCAVVKVAQVSGSDVILAGRLRTHLSAGLSVVEVVPATGCSLADLTIDGAGAVSIATGLEVRGAIDFVADDVGLTGFCRSDVGVFDGSHAVLLKTWRGGGSNAHVMVEASHDVVCRGTRCDPTGARFHSTLGVKRHLLTFWGDVDGAKIEDVELQGAGAGILFNFGHGTRIDGALLRDMWLDPVHDSMAAAGEGFLTAPAMAVIQGNNGDVDWAGNQVVPIWSNLTVLDCLSEYGNVAGKAPAYGIHCHDGGINGVNWVVANSGSQLAQIQTPAGDGRNWIRGVRFQDVGGGVSGITVRGVPIGIDLGGNFVPNVDGYLFENSSGDPVNDVAGYAIGIEMAAPLTGSPPVPNSSGGRWTNVRINAPGGIRFIANYPPRDQVFEDMVVSGDRHSTASWWINNTGALGVASRVERGQAVVADESGAQVLAGYPQVKQFTGAVGELVLVAISGERDAPAYEFPYSMLFAPLQADWGVVLVRSADAVRPGDKLVVDATVVGSQAGRDFEVDNAATSGYVIATGSKNSGARGLVPVRGGGR